MWESEYNRKAAAYFDSQSALTFFFEFPRPGLPVCYQYSWFVQGSRGSKKIKLWCEHLDKAMSEGVILRPNEMGSVIVPKGWKSLG